MEMLGTGGAGNGAALTCYCNANVANAGLGQARQGTAANCRKKEATAMQTLSRDGAGKVGTGDK